MPNDQRSCEEGKATGYCNDCGDFLCDDCQTAHKRVKLSRNHNLTSLDELKSQVTSLVSPRKAIPNCPKHSENALKMYCDTCSTLICTDCTIRFHKDHSYDLVVDVIAHHKEELVSSLNPLKEKLASVQQALKNFDQRAAQISNQESAIEANICREIDEQHLLLDQRKAELKSELKMLTDLKQKDLATQRDHVEMTEIKLTSCLEYAERALKTGTDGEVLKSKASVLKRIEHISSGFDSDSLRPKTVADTEILPKRKESLQQVCQGFLEIDHGRSCSAENSNTTGDGLKDAKIGETKTVIFEPIAENSKPYKGQLNLKAELVHMKSKNKVQCEVNPQHDGQYIMISYCPVYRGKHELQITVNEDPVRSSPFPIAVTGQQGKPIRVVKGLRKPRGVVVNSKGQFVVADGNGTSISVLTAEGEKIQSFGELKSAYEVTVDQNDNIYVVEESSCRVHKFSTEGVLLATVGKKGGGNLEFKNPWDICYNPGNNNLYVPDQGNNRMQVLTTDLTFVCCFGTSGSGNGQFQKPVCVAFDSAYNCYVTECGNRRIQVFSAGGQFLRMFSFRSSSIDRTNWMAYAFPVAIAIDSNDMVYVSDFTSTFLTVFTSQGMHITTFDLHRPYFFFHIHGIGGLCVDNNDSVIKTDYTNGQLHIF